MGSATGTIRLQRTVRLLGIALIAALGAFAGLEGSSRVATAAELFVTNFSANGSMTVYLRTASGNAKPLRTLTGLSFPAGVAVDTEKDEIAVVNAGAPSIAFYPRRANGNAPPLRTITGPSLNVPIGLALDLEHDEVLVTNSGSIAVFSRTDGAALREIRGPATGLLNAVGIAVDPVHHEILVANLDSNSVTVYGRRADGNVAPLRTIAGPNTGLDSPNGLALDLANDEVLVANGGSDSVTVYSLSTANGDAAPLRTITGLDNPQGLTVDAANGEVVVANFGGSPGDGTVTAYDLTADGNGAALRTLGGPATGLNGVAFPAVRITPCGATFDFDFASGEYADCFRGLVRASEISDGPDFGNTGQSAVNFKGGNGPTPGTWLTAYDATPKDSNPGPMFGAGTLCADILIVPFNNIKGAGVMTLLNEGVGKEGVSKKGLALVIHEAGNTDTLVLSTVDGDPAKKGKPTKLKSVSLNGKISGKVWYRLIMTTVEDSHKKWTVTGKVFPHATPTDPNSKLKEQVGTTLTWGPEALPAGVTSPGQNGLVASAVTAVLNTSVTNFSNDAARCTQ